jgi:hypothetical protein
MIAQMSLVSLSVKLAALPGVLGALISSILRWIGEWMVDWWMIFFYVCDDVRS